MVELLATQRAFASALRGAAASAEAERCIVGDAGHVRRRLAIYRANVQAAAGKALAAAYPVVRQVVGDAFFDALAQAYRREHPSTGGDLNAYGADVAAFVQAFGPTRDLPYLPDLARLEWAVHVAHGAADAPACDLGVLAAATPRQQAAVRLRFAPGCALVESPHPIARIWQIHQPVHGGAFSVDWRVAECALVARDGLRVTVSALNAGEAAFLGACLNDAASLGTATEAALAVAPGFDLAGLLARAISTALITRADLGDDA